MTHTLVNRGVPHGFIDELSMNYAMGRPWMVPLGCPMVDHG